MEKRESKMKKVMFSSFIALLVGTSYELADDNTTLTTKNYVDSGLRAVYGKIAETAAGAAYNNTTSGLTANTIQGAVDEIAGQVSVLDDAVGNTTLTTTAQTLTGAIEEVKGTADNAANKDLSNLSATGTAVITTAVTNNAAAGTYDNTTSGLTATTIQDAIDEVASQQGMNLPTTTDGTTYVYKDGNWVQLSIENQWSDSVLTQQP